METVKGGITAPSGFSASGTACGLKKSKKKDLGLIVSEFPAAAAGVFTRNRVVAAPVQLCRERLREGMTRAIIVNSGNANCCTGSKGLKDAAAMAKYSAAALGIEERYVLVASTGVIGRPLPIAKVKSAVPSLVKKLSNDSQASRDFVEAIMTTDTRPKEIAVSVPMGERAVKIGAVAKGAGMIAPDVATMLCFITTDARISAGTLKTALTKAAEDSFNMLTVDGDMSTNDTVLIMANGASGTPEILPTSSTFGDFCSALRFVCVELARMMAEDGEGATKLIEVTVQGAATKEEARKAVMSVCRSNLVKTMVHGQDPNWGRIASAVGSSGVRFEPAKWKIFFGKKKVLSGSVILSVREEETRKMFKEKRIEFSIDLAAGKETAAGWTCDLSRKYVDINASYST